MDDESHRVGLDPSQMCASTICALEQAWDELKALLGQEPGDFIPEVFRLVWNSGIASEDIEQEIAEWDANPADEKVAPLVLAILAGCASAVQGMRAHEQQDLEQAWNYAARSQYWQGIVDGVRSMTATGTSPASFAKLGADARHREDRAIKAEIMKWLDENRTPDLNGDQTATAIAGKLAPISWRTARDYITEWKRKQRSAGRP